ncbi:hypothetical protein L1987_71067 [Smallanthus sonchifolius]|uniref:Uncharacterized protein n=1 Tax=Smallanthus sonchifolius TaxID=185202 RepID=A0ACB9AS82_9ASTR|nr:hypothetical protein L1987_71067 [Smallanthus sonchifolius]
MNVHVFEDASCNSRLQLPKKEVEYDHKPTKNPISPSPSLFNSYLHLHILVKQAIMASGSVSRTSSISQSEETPGDDTKWWLHLQLDEECSKVKKLNSVIGDTSHEKPQDDHLLISENPEKLSSEMESQLIGINKAEPWWRKADLVSDESLEHFDKFDPQRFVLERGLPSLDQVSNLTNSMPSFYTSIGMKESHTPCKLDNPLSSITSDEAKNLQELSKAELLEALCHSQTRAREAEKAAQQAYNEKEHMITHFLKQASQLFAFKQWLYILQLETTCLQLRSRKYQLVYTHFPDFVTTKDTKRAARGSPRLKWGWSILGLTLAGAGFLLGWTLGWLLR